MKLHLAVEFKHGSLHMAANENAGTICLIIRLYRRRGYGASRKQKN